MALDMLPNYVVVPANSDNLSGHVDDYIPPSLVHQIQARTHDAANKGFRKKAYNFWNEIFQESAVLEPESKPQSDQSDQLASLVRRARKDTHNPCV